ncbi:hypothetical protein ANDO1_2299 [plant metagenome]|uniref:Uncharacterized protein n=1 Tax=plant metagenome TaxID=1297885 RepID=A0A484NWS0_9ZZZZ
MPGCPGIWNQSGRVSGMIPKNANLASGENSAPLPLTPTMPRLPVWLE